jgi:hypothetical protein
MDWTPIVAGAIAGLCTGALGSLGAPWVQHAVETRRSRLQRRAELIAEWRVMVALYLDGGPAGGPSDITKYRGWLSLRPHLTRTTLALFPPGLTPPDAFGVNIPLQHVSDEIDALEREWGLV